jgi:hypothetical protein
VGQQRAAWRSLIDVHQAAEIFPEIVGKEFDELVADIRQHGGIKVPLVFWKNPDSGKRLLLDGRNRLNAVEIAIGPVVLGENDCPTAEGPQGPMKLWSLIEKGDPAEIVLSLNVRRRHLDSELKRELIDKLLKDNPERSDSATATLAGVSDKTVTKRRKEKVARSEIPNVKTRKDTKGRAQPASKPPRLENPKPAPSQVRDETTSAFLKKLHNKPLDTLKEIARILRDNGKILAEVGPDDRVELARDYLAALGVKATGELLPDSTNQGA